jgi:hypothetical protein
MTNGSYLHPKVDENHTGMVGYVDIAVKIESKKRVSLIRIY